MYADINNKKAAISQPFYIGNTLNDIINYLLILFVMLKHKPAFAGSVF